ncbi:MAG: stress response translation initiation inhibitor YciH [Candidatus Bilamarchaeaceae archaeon]
MSDICPKCGMPKDLCVCEILDKEDTQKIKVYVAKKKFRKYVTMVEGIDPKKAAETASMLKQKLACGGSAKDGVIVLQGDHKKNIADVLMKLGYLKESIQVSDRIIR